MEKSELFMEPINELNALSVDELLDFMDSCVKHSSCIAKSLADENADEQKKGKIAGDFCMIILTTTVLMKKMDILPESFTFEKWEQASKKLFDEVNSEVEA